MDQQVNVVVFAVEFDQSRFEIMANRGEDLMQIVQYCLCEYPPSVLCDKDQVNMNLENAMSSMSEFG